MDTAIYDKAHNIMRLRQEKAQAENDKRIQEINEKIPETREINSLLFNTGMEILKAIKNGGDVEKNVGKIKEKNLGLQKRLKYLLISNDYPEDYLDMHYICPKCSDTGYIDSSFCDCMNQLFGRLMAEQFNQNTSLELSHFEDFDLKYYQGEDYIRMQKILNFTRNYAENFTPGAESIMMSGNTGLGKTHLSLAIADSVIRKGIAVIYDSAINVLDSIENEHFSREHSRETLDSVLGADLLILDDLGTEHESKFFVSMVYNIINTRLVRRKSTIISTNLSIRDISARYDGKVASRLLTEYTQLQFSGKDVRLQLKKAKRGI
ncbi:MAG: ATP-binding protein [Ruminococcus sp.]|nr:ATP-binding protein [Ruminococcus sp.]